MRVLAVFTIVLAAVLAPQLASAAITVDFGSVTTTTDITKPNSLHLSGVTLSYDNFGADVDGAGNPVTASVDSSGVFGNTFGSLIFDFDAPATNLSFDFALLGVFGSVKDALFINFKFMNGSIDVGDVTAKAKFVPYDKKNRQDGGDALGSLAFSGAEFDQALMFFSTDASLFTVSNVSYDFTSANVPEPTSVLVWGGLFGLCGWRLLRRKQGT